MEDNREREYMEMGLVHRNEVVCIRCEYCGSKEMKAWWPSADERDNLQIELDSLYESGSG